MPISAETLIGTIQKMSDEGQALYDKHQQKPSSTTKYLVEALAKARLDDMSSQQIQSVIKETQKTKQAAQQQEELERAKKQRSGSKEKK